MITYPSIARQPNREVNIIAFDKLDGSNIRVEWTPKNGFSKFGTRKRLLSPGELPLGGAILIFKREWETKLTKICKKQKWIGKDMRVTFFFEFYGPRSFAGHHEDEIEDMKLTLIDAHVYKKGLIPPREFIKIFKNVDTPKVLYEGKGNNDLQKAVADGTLEGMTFEGVVCKGLLPGKKKKQGKIVMFKFKSNAWIDQLKYFCGDNNAMFKELE